MRKEYLRIANGTKRNADTEQLHDFCLTVYEGEVAEIVGSRIREVECLEALLSGQDDFSSGSIFFRGEKISVFGATKLLRGHFVELANCNELVEQISIADNVFSLRKEAGPLFVHEKENRMLLKQMLDRFLLTIDPDQETSSLSHLQRYQIRLLKLYLDGVEAVLLDQREMDLTNEEFLELYRLVHMLKHKGITFLVLDYVLPREWNMVDTLTVVQNGSTVLEYDTNSSRYETQQQAAVRALSNHETCKALHPVRQDAPIVLQLDQLATEKISKIDMILHAGEIAAVFCTSHEVEMDFFQVLSGYKKPIAGRLLIDGVPASAENHAKRIRQGVLSVGNCSSESYIFETLSVFDNYCLQKGLRVKRIWWDSRYRRFLRNQLDRMFDRNISSKPMRALSPIEIQKLKFKSCLLTHPKILICLNPFSSVDIKMSLKANCLIQELADTGIAVLVLSQYHSTEGIPGIKGYTMSNHGLLFTSEPTSDTEKRLPD